jgi:hypothetical protein
MHLFQNTSLSKHPKHHKNPKEVKSPRVGLEIRN